MYCSSCGADLAAQAVICPKCGNATPNFRKSESSSKVSGGVIATSYVAGALFPTHWVHHGRVPPWSKESQAMLWGSAL